MVQASHVVEVGHQVEQDAFQLGIEKDRPPSTSEEEWHHVAERLKDLVHWNLNRTFEALFQLLISRLRNGFDGGAYLREQRRWRDDQHDRNRKAQTATHLTGGPGLTPHIAFDACSRRHALRRASCTFT
jgi:hypothetical protein